MILPSSFTLTEFALDASVNSLNSQRFAAFNSRNVFTANAFAQRRLEASGEEEEEGLIALFDALFAGGSKLAFLARKHERIRKPLNAARYGIYHARNYFGVNRFR